MKTRRSFIATTAGMLAWPWLPHGRARAAESPLAPVIDKITGGKVVRAGRVQLEAPHLADNGHSVPLKIRVQSPMTAGDHVRSIAVLSERNPRPVIATYHLGPKSGRPEVATRIRLNGTQNVVVIAELSDGTFWSGSIEVIVTESACLDDT